MKSALILVLSPLFVIATAVESLLPVVVAVPSTAVDLGVFGVTESVTKTVNEGDSLPLETGIKIQGSDEVEWRFNDRVIYVISSVAGDIKVLDQTDGAFGGRLQLDKQTGNLQFTNIKTTDSGQYTLNISSTKGTSDKIFNVDVSRKQPDEVKPDPGLSSGAIAGIVIAVLIAVAAAIGGIYYFYRKKGEML